MKDKYSLLFIERLKEERKRLGYTQQDIADKLDISRVHWGNTERGKFPLNSDHLLALFELGADINYILTGNPTDDETSHRLSSQETELLELFREANSKAQITAINVLELGK